MKTPFLDKLNQSKMMLFDGATGTIIFEEGITYNNCYGELNLSRPELIKNIHKNYALAGADIITTNTITSSKLGLEKYNLVDKTEEINHMGVELAREALAEVGKEYEVYVAGSMGPLGYGRSKISDAKDLAKECFIQQAKSLYNSGKGVDIIALETFTNMEELHLAIQSVRSVCDLPIISMITIHENGRSFDGFDVKEYSKKMDEFGADVIGLNCSNGPENMLNLVDRMLKTTNKPICMQPNAGVPKRIKNSGLLNPKLHYPFNEKQMAEYAVSFVSKGVKLFGSCCGTTARYTKSILNALENAGFKG